MRSILRHTLCFSLAVGLVSGCGAAEHAAKSPGGGAPEPEPTTVEEAQAQLERARRELEGPLEKTAPTSTSAVTPSASAPPPPAADTSAAGGAPFRTPTASEDSCATPCRAMASMRRAVAAICRLAGDADARCTDAKSVLERNEARVAQCSCPKNP